MEGEEIMVRGREGECKEEKDFSTGSRGSNSRTFSKVGK